MKKEMKKSGFTLVEIMIVVMIIGLLAALGIPNFLKARKNTLRKKAVNNARIVLDAVQQYAMEHGTTGNVDQSDYLPFVKGGSDALAIGGTAPSTLGAISSATNYDPAVFASNTMYKVATFKFWAD